MLLATSDSSRSTDCSTTSPINWYVVIAKAETAKAMRTGDLISFNLISFDLILFVVNSLALAVPPVSLNQSDDT